METCATCRFWREITFIRGEEGLGECNRLPPMFLRDIRRGGVTIGLGNHPVTTRNDYCGEHAEESEGALPSKATDHA